MSIPAREHPYRRWWIFLAIGAVLAIIAASVVIFTINGRPTPATVTLMASATPGPNPFTDSVAPSAPAVPAPAVVAKSAALRKTLPADKNTHLMVAAGTMPGLYGGTEQESVCEPGKLVTFLAAHPDKAAAWAGVQGITAAGIGAFVATLTPVLLNSDTLVTNHGFIDGKADPFPSVLQAGTAVLVDAGGTPRAKCNCGNPLSAPELLDLTTATVTGTPWPGYAPAQVTIVQAGKATGTLTLVDIVTGGIYAVGPGAAAGLWVAAAVDTAAATPWTTVISTSTDGKDWADVASIPGESVYALASGGGVWVAAASQPWDWGRVTAPTQLFESADLRSWHLVASLDDHVSGVAFGDGHWIATGYQQSTGTGLLAWQSSDGQHWAPATSTLGDGGPGRQHLTTLAYGDGRWVSVVADPAPPSATFADAQPAPLAWTAASSDGLSWPTLAPLPGKATGASLAFGGGKWLIVQNKFVPGTAGGPGANVSSVAVGSDGSSWTASPATGIGTSEFSAVAYGNGGWLAALSPGPGSSDSVADFDSTTFYSSADAKAWTSGTRMAQFVQALAFGPAPGAAATPVTATPATATAIPTATAAPAANAPQSAPAAGNSPPASPAGAATTQPGAGAAGLCSPDTVLAVVNAGRPADQQLSVSPANIHCAESWIAAGVDDTVNGAQYTVVLQSVNGSWTKVDRQEACSSGAIPAGLAQLACNSN